MIGSGSVHVRIPLAWFTRSQEDSRPLRQQFLQWSQFFSKNYASTSEQNDKVGVRVFLVMASKFNTLRFRCYPTFIVTRPLWGNPEMLRFTFILTQHTWKIQQNCYRPLYSTLRSFQTSTLFLESVSSGFLCSTHCITTLSMLRSSWLNPTPSKLLGFKIGQALRKLLRK